MLFEAYHASTAAFHDAAFKRLVQSGYRMIDLSVYGGASNARYNVVWVKRPGPQPWGFHGLNRDDMLQWVYDAKWEGYQPVLIAASGDGNDAVFAGSFERGVADPCRIEPTLDKMGFELVDAQCKAGGMILRSLAIYGPSTAPLYAAVWHARSSGVRSNLRSQTTAANYQGVFKAEATNPYFRPRLVAVASDQSIVSVFSNDTVGDYRAVHGLTKDQYQTAFNANKNSGRMPICVSAGGSGGSARFAAIFAERDISPKREWTAIGTKQGLLSDAETTVEKFMKQYGVRCAQFTVLRKGSVALRRAYTWSEPGTRKTKLTDLMLLASNSKLFVNAACNILYRKAWTNYRMIPKLLPTTKVYPFLGFSMPKDARADSIEVQQLLDMCGGYNQSVDPTYNMRTIALALVLSRPPTPKEFTKYIYKNEDLAYAPGSVPVDSFYNNYSYVLAALVAEKAAGTDYLAFLRNKVLKPINVTEVDQSPTAGPAGWPSNMVWPEADWVGRTAVLPKKEEDVPAVFGGNGMFKETAIGSCGLAASATAVATTIRTYGVWGTGGRIQRGRGGKTAGARSWAESRAGDVDWALIFNTADAFEDVDFNRLIGAVNVDLDAWQRTLRSRTIRER